jgi:hypothetical protein
VARYLAGRTQLPSKEDQKEWEADRLRKRGDGQQFFKVAPDFEDYFEGLRELAGEPGPGVPGRRLLKWDPAWLAIADSTMQNRIKNWKETAAVIEKQLDGGRKARPFDG